MSPQFPSSRPRTPPKGAIHFRQTLPFAAEKISHPRSQTRWKKALLCSAIWLALLLSTAVFHTNVVHSGKLRQADEAALSERYGMICGVGLVVIVAVIFSRRRA